MTKPKITSEFEIIAEIAQGYEGKTDQALLLAKAAINADADGIKYQMIFADELCTPEYKYYNLFKSLEMPFEEWQKISNYVHLSSKNLYFDVFGEKSLMWASLLKADGIKLHSSDFFNLSLLTKSLEKFEKIFVSMGGIEYPQIIERVKFLNEKYCDKDITYFYGFQSEPTLIDDNHLNRLKQLISIFPLNKFGFMDHSLGEGHEAFCLSAVTLGLGIVKLEKHISLDRSLQIEDYISALPPSLFSEFVSSIKSLNKSFGIENLVLTAKEQKYATNAIKFVVARRELLAGDTINEDDISLKRLPPSDDLNFLTNVSSVIGKKLKKNKGMNEAIVFGDLDE